MRINLKNKSMLTLMIATSLIAKGSEIDNIENNIVNGTEEKVSSKITNKKIKNKRLEKNLKNKKEELDNLYAQANYIVKPEYLEWQLFNMTFDKEKEKGDATLKNAKYYSGTTTQSGKSTINSEKGLVGEISSEGEFKQYTETTEKAINLGLNIKLKDVDKQLDEVSIEEPKVNIITEPSFTLPSTGSIVAPTFNVVTFNPIVPTITTLNFDPIPVLNLSGTGGGNGGVTGFFPYGDMGGYNSIISQMDLTSGSLYARTKKNPDFAGDPYMENDPGYFDYTLNNLIGNPSAGLEYTIIDGYEDPITGEWIELGATLPVGVYSDGILNSPDGYINRVQALLKVIDNPITRIGVAGSNPEDLKITLEGDVANPMYLEQILHYDEHYSGMIDPITEEWKVYTLDDLEAHNWITATEKAELASKFLDTKLGHTTADRAFQYVENNGTWELKGGNVVAVNLQAHGGGSEANAIFSNRGKILGLNEASSTENALGKHVAFMFTEGSVYAKQEGFDNTGSIEMRTHESVGYLLTMHVTSSNTNKETNLVTGEITINDSLGKHFLMNSGDFKFYGNSNIGIYTYNAAFENYSEYTNIDSLNSYKNISTYNGLRRSEIILNAPLTMLGDQSTGLNIERMLSFHNAKIKVDVGTEDPKQNITSATGANGLENSGNIITGDNRYTDSSTGMSIDMSRNYRPKSVSYYNYLDPSQNYSDYTETANNEQFTLDDYAFNIGEFSRSGVAVRAENYADLILGSSTDASKSNEINLLANGESNVGIYIKGAYDDVIPFYNEDQWGNVTDLDLTIDGLVGARVTADGLIMNVDGTHQVGVQVEDNGIFHHKSGEINILGLNSTGVVIKNTDAKAYLTDTAKLNITNGSLGIYNNGTFNMTGGSIDASSLGSVAIYSETNNITTNLSGGNIKVSDGAIALFAGNNSVINLNQGINLEAINKGLLFYNGNNAATIGKFNVTGNVNAVVGADGKAFYISKDVFTANGGSFVNYLNSSVYGSGMINLDLKDNSTLFLLDGEGTTFNLSSLGSNFTYAGQIADNVNIAATSEDFKTLSMNKGHLVIDQNVNLNDEHDIYNNSEFMTVSVTVDPGKTMTGNTTGQHAILEANYIGTTGTSEISLINNGEINLSGNGSVGIASSYGEITNNNIISATGNESVAIYSANGTSAKNNNTINISGVNTVGIYGANYLDGITPSTTIGYGNDKINIENNGTILSLGGKTYGIYADNKLPARADSVITLTGASNIDLKNSTDSVGMYVVNSTVNGTGTITVGQGSTAIYAKDSDVNLTGMNINLHGDNSLGAYLTGTTNFTGSGNINIDGKNVTLFYVDSTGNFTNNFTVSSTAGSTYSIGQILNGSFIYDGIANLASNGALISGENSTVLINSNGQVLSTAPNVVGVYLKGQYTGAPVAGMTSGIEAENKGLISLGDNSAAIYGTNGVRINNQGTAIVGKDSIALRTDGVNSTVDNSGVIGLGENSTGIYGNESTTLTNAGNISSTQIDAVGIYGLTSGTQTINNRNQIILDGDNSTGIYAGGTGNTIVNNTGEIKIGPSILATRPSVGIYGKASDVTINNIGKVEAGDRSVGIYSQLGTVNHTGEVSVGNTGTAIFLDGSNATLSGASQVRIGNDDAVGVYGINESTVTSDAIMNVGNESFGYVVKSNSSLLNNGVVNMTSNGVGLYSDTGIIDNRAAINMNNDNNIGIYSINGSTIDNIAAITGTGAANIGIYSNNGIVRNSGAIKVQDSIIRSETDALQNDYAVGIYSENSTIDNTGNIEVGYYGVGIFSEDSTTVSRNTGTITSASDKAIGIFLDNAKMDNYGDITLDGKETIGIYVNNGSEINNYAVITVNGDNAKGIYLNRNSILNNQGTINVNGQNSAGILMNPNSTILNNGTINLGANALNSETIKFVGNEYEIPTLVNAGIIHVDGNFNMNDLEVEIKVDPSTIKYNPTVENGAFESDAVKFIAESFVTGRPISITPDFALGTNVSNYKLTDVFIPKAEMGDLIVKSKSFTFEAIPVTNANGNIDIWMKKIPYDKFTSGLWYEEFGKNLDGKYENATGQANEIFDKLDIVEHESDFRDIMAGLSGDVYSNMNQKEMDIESVFEDSISLMQDSPNKTKEVIKINTIGGKGSTKEDTDGVNGYDYKSIGAQVLREVERTYRHKIGYSLGYLHTTFDIEDAAKSKDKTNTIQVGAYSNYRMNNNFVITNSLTGKVSFHDMTREVAWVDRRDEIKGKYQAYSVVSDNEIGREVELGKNAKVTPYAGMYLSYGVRGGFTEKGLEALEVKGNDAFSVKPKVGVKIEGTKEFNTVTAKAGVDLSYEYELANGNPREYARLVNIEDSYHRLSKPSRERGTFKIGGNVGLEIKERVGVYLTGEYKWSDHETKGIDNSKYDGDYRVGLGFKASF